MASILTTARKPRPFEEVLATLCRHCPGTGLHSSDSQPPWYQETGPRARRLHVPIRGRELVGTFTRDSSLAFSVSPPVAELAVAPLLAALAELGYVEIQVLGFARTRAADASEGQPLRLNDDGLPENAPRFAADAVATVRRIKGVELDYSPASLQSLDAVLEQMRSDGVVAGQGAETLFAFGCYVGEIFVRHAGGSWRRTSDTPMAGAAGFPLVIDFAGKRYCNPIGKVFKRLNRARVDSLPLFYEAFARTHEPPNCPLQQTGPA